jgi:hypothetical protein
MRARSNKMGPMGRVKVRPDVDLEANDIDAGVKAARKWSWHDGKDPSKMPELEVLDIPDPELGDMKIVACGRLVRIHVRAPKQNPTHPRRERDTMLELSRRASENSYLGYELGHPYDRLHIILDPDVQKGFQQRFWRDSTAPRIEMNQLASLAGGKHGKLQDYPDLEVKPVGVMTAVVYYTDKEGDGASYYIHKMAELSHNFPILACDDLGRLWILGGSYTAPTPGITD